MKRIEALKTHIAIRELRDINLSEIEDYESNSYCFNHEYFMVITKDEREELLNDYVGYECDCLYSDLNQYDTTRRAITFIDWDDYKNEIYDRTSDKYLFGSEAIFKIEDYLIYEL